MASDDARNGAGGLFADDEETWNLLVSATASPDDDNMMSRLTSLGTRFQEDSDAIHEKYWERLSKSVQELGIRVPTSSSTTTAVAPSAGADQTFPAAFQTDWGKKHLKATTSLLRISELRAVQLTLSALRAVTSDAASRDDKTEITLSSLLGTRLLLHTVMTHYFQQRLARLRVTAECLRMEQDESAKDRDAIVHYLDTLDATTVTAGRTNRGLFRRLLTTACGPAEPPTREELLPSLDLKSEDASASLSITRVNRLKHEGEFSWDAFVEQCMEVSRTQAHRERVEAMEAILVLLYQRIQNGVQRVDYAMLLVAFQSCNTFFTNGSDNERLCQLAGLICAECMSLWRAFSDQEDAESPAWVMEHPLLLGVVGTSDHSSESAKEAEEELDALRSLLARYSNQVLERRTQRLAGSMGTEDVDDSMVEAPEAVALLTFGLLLRLAYVSILESDAGSDADAYWQEFDNYGFECTRIANDECGAFAYLHSTMQSLVSAPPAPRVDYTNSEEASYDWLLSDPSSSSPLLLTDNSSVDDTSAGTVAYASIGREVLTSTIAAFRDTILSIEHPAACENIGMLCSLAAVIFQNHAVLCEPFWLDWESYTARATTAAAEGNVTSRAVRDDPLCYLMDAAYALSASALNATSGMGQPAGIEEALLPALAPLLRLVSSLCSNSDVVQSVVGVLPNGMIRTALLCCSPTTQLNDPTAFFKKAVNGVVDSVGTLARIGISGECRLVIRKALETENDDSTDGPRLLYRIVTSTSRMDIAAGALQILADLLQNTPGDPSWPLSVAKCFAPSSAADSGFAPFLTRGSNDVTFSAVRILEGLVSHLATIAFCSSFKEQEISEYMSTVMHGTLAACRVLSSTLAMTGSNLRTKASVCYPIAQSILELLGTLLMSIRPVTALQGSPFLRSAALEVRNTLINTLATSTSLGEVIAYFASAPVSLSLAVALDENLREAQVLSLASDEEVADQEASKYGAWRSMVRNPDESKSPEDVSALVGAYMKDLMVNMDKLKLDMEVANSAGWIGGGDPESPLRAARASLQVLLRWGMHAEDIVLEAGSSERKLTNAAADLGALSPYRLLSSLAAVPPPIRENDSLLSVWPRERLTNLSLILRYLVGAGEDSSTGDKSVMNLPTTVTLEVLTMCLVHAKHAAGCQVADNPSLSRTLGSTEQLHRIAYQAVKSTWTLTDANSKRSFTHNEKVQVKQTLLLLRMLSTCVKTNSLLATSILIGADGESALLVDLLAETVSQVVNLLQRSENDYLEQLSHDEILMSQLRIASGCMGIFSGIWKSARTPETSYSNDGLTEVIKMVVRGGTAGNFLSDLVTIIMHHASATKSVQKEGEEGLSAARFQHSRSVLMKIMSSSLDILAIEMMLAPIITSVPEEDAIRSLMEQAPLLVSVSEHFTNFDGALLLSKAWSSFSVSLQSVFPLSANELWPADVLFSFPTTFLDRFEGSNSGDDNLFNVSDVAGFLARLSTAQGYDPLAATENIGNLCASYVLLLRELSLISSWKQFAQIPSLLNERITETSPPRQVSPSPTAGVDRNSRQVFATTTGGETRGDSALMNLSMAQETVSSLHSNVITAELSKLEVSGSFLSSESGTMACALAELVLHSLNQYQKFSDAVPLATRVSVHEALASMLGQLQDSSDKLFTVVLPLHSTIGAPPLRVRPAAHGEVQDVTWVAFCILQQRLLASAVILIEASENDPRAPLTSPHASENQKLRDEVHIGFVGIASKILGLLEPNSSSIDGTDQSYQDLLRTCVSLLTLLVSSNTGSLTPARGNEYFSNFAESIRKHNAITLLMRHANVASIDAASAPSPLPSQLVDGSAVSSTLTDGKTAHHQRREIAVDIVRSIFELVSAIAVAGDVSMDMLSLLANSCVSRLIVSNPLLQHASRQWAVAGQTSGSDGGSAVHPYIHMRGYLPAESQANVDKHQTSGGRFLAGRDDPVHDVWRTTIGILVEMVRCSRHYVNGEGAETMNQHFIRVALDFLNSNETSLLLCLAECSSVPFGEKREPMLSSSTTAPSMRPPSVVFTLNLLREACDIVSLVSELCTGINLNQFESASPKLYKAFVKASLAMTSSLCNFLGAAGTARELFAALTALESTTEESPSPGDAVPNYSNGIHPLLAGGIPTARHEAIRNAHFAIRCCAFVTADEYEASHMFSSLKSVGGSTSPEEGNTEEQVSASSLEKNCQVAVTSTFVLRMELAAGKCLFHSLSVVWKTHPSSSCFVLFSPEEAARLDSMSIVKAGMIIALRPPGESGSGSFSSILERADSNRRPDPDLRFARVLGRDTVRRTWRVQFLDSSLGRKRNLQSEEIVNADYLAGVEDMMKRKCVFVYAPAPDSAQAVEAAGATKGEATLGHLILALRWCHQYLSIPERENQNCALTQCLAERTSVLLGTEVSLHEENGTAKMVSTDISKRVNAQLFDLFGDWKDGDSAAAIGIAPIETGRQGRLKSIIDASTWAAIQKQLQPELEAAKKDIEENQRKNEQSSFGMTAAKPYRKTGLFRGISF